MLMDTCTEPATNIHPLEHMRSAKFSFVIGPCAAGACCFSCFLGCSWLAPPPVSAGAEEEHRVDASPARETESDVVRVALA